MGKQKVNKTDEEWKDSSDEEYRVLRQKGTEYPQGKYNLHFETEFIIVMAARPLFNSDQKFETGGWPSFDEAIKGAIKYVDDYSHNMIRPK